MILLHVISRESMSFRLYKQCVEEGDTVILYISINSLHAFDVVKKVTNKHGKLIDNVFQTTYGALKVADLIGKRYGTKVNMSKGWAYILQPTPELWTLTLPHRTQILYTPDISLVTMGLDLRPGSVVVEAGTGSGSLSHALIRTVAPTGHLYTFDFHENRVRTAEQEFARHGLASYVTVSQRDVCSDGFGLEQRVDAVFLDLPRPWDAVCSAKVSLKQTGGRLCSFSPCIEQVQKTCLALKEAGFIDISTCECLLREYQLRNITSPCVDLEYDETMALSEEEEEMGTGDTDAVTSTHCDTVSTTTLVNSTPPPRKKRKLQDKGQWISKMENFQTTVPLLSMPGHTGFLTFATLLPKTASLDLMEDDVVAEAFDN